MKKRSTINFNHVSEDLSEEYKQKITDLFKFYHKLFTCYKWKYKRLRKIVFLTMFGIGLTCIGTVAGGITLNPIILGAMIGPGVLIKGYMVKSNILRNVERCKYAYTNYKTFLCTLRNAMRGVSMDENSFLIELRLIDDIVTDTCPDIDDFTARYEKTFE